MKFNNIFTKFNIEKPQKLGKKAESKMGGEVPYDFWMKFAKEMYERYDGKLIKISNEIIKKLGIPNGQYSVLFKNKDGNINTENSKEFATKVSNIAGIKVADENEQKINRKKEKIDVEGPIISVDLRDYYESGLPEELKKIMNPHTLAFIENEFEIRKEIIQKFGKDSTLEDKADCSIYYQKLSNDCDVILRGYAHGKEWHTNFEESLTNASKNAQYIGIEGFSDKKFGNSLGLWWNYNKAQGGGHFDKLMKQAVVNGFKGEFLEFDGRDNSGVSIDNVNVFIFRLFPNLPDSFLVNYLNYLYTLNPKYKEDIKDINDLKNILEKLSTTIGNLENNTPEKYISSQAYSSLVSLNKDGKYTTEPNEFIFGQRNYSDALSALKIHFMNRLMEKGKIEKGLVVDYQGAYHLPLKAFYLKNPELAISNVLQNIPHLIINYLFKEDMEDVSELTEEERQERFERLNKELKNIDFEKVLLEIGRLPRGKVEEINEDRDSVEVGDRQRRLNMNEEEWNVFTMLNIDTKELAGKIKKMFDSDISNRIGRQIE